MESVPFTGEPEGRELQEVMAQFDAPAYIRRAKGVENALQDLLAKCHRQRDEWLPMVKLRLGQLYALAGDWPVLRPLVVDDDQLLVLESLHGRLSPKLRLPPGTTTSERVLRSALRELVSSVERFNARWQAFLAKMDFTRVNELRDGYNKHYVLEKACALRNDVLASRGFAPMTPMTLDELAEHLPPLPAPRVAE